MELDLDNLLKIKTKGRDDSQSNYENFPYEPTPYAVLERLSSTGYIRKNDILIDFGSGKGRVDFYLAYQVKCQMIGIEYDKRLYEVAQMNKETAKSSSRVNFIKCNASDYEASLNTTGAYFFNPFSIDILKGIVIKLKNRKGFKLFFYYPSTKYIDFLRKCSFIKLIDKIDCTDLEATFDDRECVLYYEIV